MTDLEKWIARRRVRRLLLDRAERSVRWWSKRAGSRRGKQMLDTAVERRARRRLQVREADKHIERLTRVSGVSAKGVEFVASFEGFRSRPYRDPVGVWTIGYGETRNVGPRSRPITKRQARTMLRRRLDADYLKPVLAAAKGAGLVLKQHEADALASLVYNCGPGILAPGRSMGDALRSRDRARIANAILAYDMAGGRSLPGLVRRRRAERKMFLGS
jgi:lysozyme